MENYKIGFIGFGNMAQALADGLLLKKAVAPQDLYACAKDYEKLRQNCAQRGINPCRDAQEVAQGTDMVIIAVKPYLVAEVLSPIRSGAQSKGSTSTISNSCGNAPSRTTSQR